MIAATLASTAAAQSPTPGFRIIGGGGELIVQPTSVSDDGSRILGIFGERFGPRNGWSDWSTTDGLRLNDVVGGQASSAVLSGDGTAAFVSTAEPNSVRRLKRLDRFGNETVLASSTNRNEFIIVSAASTDGSTAAYYRTIGANATSYRWTTDLGSVALPQVSFSVAGTHMSGDGRTIVGTTGGNPYAFIWREGAGMQGFLRGPLGISTPGGVNYDGSMVVSYDGFGMYLTTDQGYTSLGLIAPGFNHQFLTLSTDGRVVGVRGRDTAIAKEVSYVWSAESGLVTLNAYLGRFGVVAPRELTNLTAVSGDGRTFAGWYRDTGEAWVVTVPAPPVVAFAGVALLGASRRRR